MTTGVLLLRDDRVDFTGVLVVVDLNGVFIGAFLLPKGLGDLFITGDFAVDPPTFSLMTVKDIFTGDLVPLSTFAATFCLLAPGDVA